jgi:fagellar hook-basal body proteins
MGSGVSALQTFMKGLEVIGNNIANVNTTGFKGSTAKYADSFSNILVQSSSNGVTTTPAVAVGTGVTLSGVTTNYTQGALSPTGKSTDLGISGNGFFRVKNPNSGEEYVTRAGDFRWDEQGYLVTNDGYRVQGLVGTPPTTVGDIKLATLAPTAPQLQSVAIDRSGNVIESYADGSTAVSGQVLLQNFKDPAALVKQGNNLYSGIEAAGPSNGSVALLADGSNQPGSNGLGYIQSGTLELSNVDLTEQFSELITTQRSFQAGSRLLTVSDSVLEDIVNLKR